MNEERMKKDGAAEKCYAFPNSPTPGMPVVIDETRCTGCNKCVTICTTDVFVANPEKGKPPIVMYPEECWYGGCCVGECPEECLTMRHPLMMRVHFKNKETGDIKRT
ncbi:MAG: NADH-plastoquinone oxidoreductase subunit [Syntrophorhabdus sp. PtaB.Bin184]|jgi:NAD-dependent dihydropyrimidine dehydrogenase PreA subunit|nr:MAG: NADH-plastoquinone oxidoreductase subunit [Syntrophorhabdus sp. PtaB.Bin184]